MQSQNDTHSYTIKTDNFEGPLGLLLGLIEKRKLHINDVSLSTVTEDYIGYMNRIGELHPGEVSSFVLVASTLLLIKSKSLLPNLNLTNEEEGDIKNLEDRLRLYEIFNKLGLNIKKSFGDKLIFTPLEKKSKQIVFLPDQQITPDSMMTLVRGVLGNMPKKIILPKVEVKKVVSIEEMISKLTDRIQDSMKMSFRDFAGKGASKEEKVVVIVGFLAMLELVRQGILSVIQDNHYGDITIEKQLADANTNTYE